MKVLERWDEKGNPIFEVKSKRIFFDLVILRKLVRRNISVINWDGGFWLGQAYEGGTTLEMNFTKIVGRNRKNLLIERDLVGVLAHEAKHTLQLRRGFFNKLGLLITYWALLPALLITAVAGMLLLGISVFLEFERWIGLVFFVLGETALIGLVGICLLYYFCPNERDARDFEREALKNEEWLKVVTVEDKDTP